MGGHVESKLYTGQQLAHTGDGGVWYRKQGTPKQRLCSPIEMFDLAIAPGMIRWHHFALESILYACFREFTLKFRATIHSNGAHRPVCCYKSQQAGSGTGGSLVGQVLNEDILTVTACRNKDPKQHPHNHN